MFFQVLMKNKGYASVRDAGRPGRGLAPAVGRGARPWAAALGPSHEARGLQGASLPTDEAHHLHRHGVAQLLRLLESLRGALRRAL